MFYDNNFKKSIILLYFDFIENKQPIKEFIKVIKKIFFIQRSTFYNWLNNKEIINLEVKKNYKNNNITPVSEQLILLNKDKKVKKIKEELTKINVSLNSKTIKYVLINNKDKIVDKDLNKTKNLFINLTTENEKFIIDNCDKQIKILVNEFINKFNIIIHEKQIVDVLYKNKKKVKSFYKKTPEIINYVMKLIKENSILTAQNIKDNIKKEFNVIVSIQLIYNIFKEQNYIFKKLKKINNPYSIDEQIKQLEKVKETHNLKNINNCVSLDEISIVINSKPRYGWFKKNTEANYKLATPKITNKRYTILMASNNKKILHYVLCEQGIKTDSFIEFMKELKSKNNNKEAYYLLDNMITHKTKKFKNYALENNLTMVYNAPYHSETNPIENIFSMFRNKINRSENNNLECIKKITDEFIKENNESKFNNIFNHSVKMIETFINNNKK